MNYSQVFHRRNGRGYGDFRIEERDRWGGPGVGRGGAL